MQSVSIEIDTNKRLGHTGSGPHCSGDQCYPPSHYPAYGSFSNMLQQSHVYPPPPSRGYAQPPCMSSQTPRDQYVVDDRRQYDCQEAFYDRSLKRTHSEIGGMCSPESGQELIDFQNKKIKTEVYDTYPTSTRQALETSRTPHEQFDLTDDAFDDPMDLLSNPFDTDIYTSMAQRLTQPLPGAEDRQQVVPTRPSDGSCSRMTPTDSKLGKIADKSKQDAAQCNITPNDTYLDSNTQFRGNNPCQQVSDPSHVQGTSYFPLYSQCMMGESGNPSCSYDQRYSAQPPLSSHNNYCNHSINITLRYK